MYVTIYTYTCIYIYILTYIYIYIYMFLSKWTKPSDQKHPRPPAPVDSKTRSPEKAEDVQDPVDVGLAVASRRCRSPVVSPPPPTRKWLNVFFWARRWLSGEHLPGDGLTVFLFARWFSGAHLGTKSLSQMV